MQFEQNGALQHHQHKRHVVCSFYFITTNRPTKIEDSLTMLLSSIKVKSEDTDTAKPSPDKTMTSTRKRPRATVPTVIFIEEDDITKLEMRGRA